MYIVEATNTITQIIVVFYRIEIESTFLTSIAFGAFFTNDPDEFVFLAATSFIVSVHTTQ